MHVIISSTSCAHWILQLGGRFAFPLTLPNIWGSSKGKSSPGINPGINPEIFMVRAPRVMAVILNLLE